MAEAVATRWEPPQVTELAESVVQIEFRDSIIKVVNGMVISYIDKELKVVLEPSDQGADAWSVSRADGTPVGQVWRGLILFDGQQLLIQQAKNAILRLYRLDGAVETQFRTCRVVETPGLRSMMFQNGVHILEDIDKATTTVRFEGYSITRKEGQEAFRVNDDGSSTAIPLPENDDPLKPTDNEAIDAFAQFLAHWQVLLNDPEPGCLRIEAPPGLREAAPGQPFRRAVKGKPDDFRECRSHDFEDGTLLYEYFGRLSGAPYTAHDVVARNGLVLARFVEYDQAKQLVILTAEKKKLTLTGVLSMEVAFEPQELVYRTAVIFADGSQRNFPE